MLHNPKSVREVGTLRYFREKYSFRNVTPEKVSRSYEGCEKFILTVGKVYTLEAALTFWGMQNLEDKPTKHIPPQGIIHMTKQVKLEYFNKVIGKFVDEYVTPNPENERMAAQSETETTTDGILQVIAADHDYVVNQNKSESAVADRVRYSV